VIERLRDRESVGSLIRGDPLLHLYELGDLDPAFWPRTAWWALREGGARVAIALLYDGLAIPTLLAMGRGGPTRRLLEAMAAAGRLPPRFYAHLAPGHQAALAGWRISPHGLHLRMGLRDTAAARAVDPGGAVPLSTADRGALEAFYAAAYPGNWFDPRTLETGACFGIREAGALVAVAGVHVVAPAQGVAALGNIAVAPARRGRGLGRAVTAALCQHLLARVHTIGLNVAADNAPAIACYRGLGFEAVADFDELEAQRLEPSAPADHP